MRTFALAALVASLAFVPSASSAEPLQFQSPELHYSLTVPDGWVRMPDDVLASREPKEPGSAPVAAFQAPADTWFHVPALVITHHPERWRRPNDLFEELARQGGLGRNGKAITHPDERGFVKVDERMPSSDGGEIERVAAFKPGTLGTLQLDFYLPKGELPAYGDQVVLQVLDSVRFEEGFAVKDLAPGERAPLIEEVTTFLRQRPTTLLMLVLGLVLMVTSILTSRRKRRG